MNLAVVRFAGAVTCTVARTDVRFDERTALEEVVSNKESATAKPALIETPATAAARAGPPPLPLPPLPRGGGEAAATPARWSPSPSR